MPKPRPGEGLDDFVERCIPDVLEHGTAEDNKQAYAICRSMWEADQEEHKTMADYFIEENSIKAATDAEKDAQKKRAAKYGISPKEKGNVTKPNKYADVPEGSFGDPVNYKYPADEAHAQPAVTYFNQSEHRAQGGYSSEEWAKIGGRLAKLVSRHLDGSYQYKDGKLQKKEEKAMPRLEIHEDSCTCKDCVVVNFGRVVRVALIEELTPAYGDEVLLPSNRDASESSLPGTIADFETVVLDSSGLQISNDSTIIVGNETVPPSPEPATKDGASLEELKSQDLTRAIKLIDETPEHFLVGGYGHVWGNSKLKDLAGEYFTPQSELWPDLVPVKFVFYDHALCEGPDKKQFDDPIGNAPEGDARIDDVGKWVQAQISKRAKWVDAVMQLVERGILAWSSGAVPHLIKRAKDGWLERWPVAEYTMTPTPCEPRQTDISRLEIAYKAAGLKWFPDNFDPEHLGTESDDVLVTRLAVERERARLLALFK